METEPWCAGYLLLLRVCWETCDTRTGYQDRTHYQNTFIVEVLLGFSAVGVLSLKKRCSSEVVRVPCSRGAGTMNVGTNPSPGPAVAGARLARGTVGVQLPVDMCSETVYKRTLCLCSSSQPLCPFTSNSMEKSPFASQPSSPHQQPSTFSIAALDLSVLFFFLSPPFISPQLHLSVWLVTHTQRVTNSILPEPQTCQQSSNAVGLRDALSPPAPPRPPRPIPRWSIAKDR